MNHGEIAGFIWGATAASIVDSLETMDIPGGAFRMGCSGKDTCEFNEESVPRTAILA